MREKERDRDRDRKRSVIVFSTDYTSLNTFNAWHLVNRVVHKYTLYYIYIRRIITCWFTKRAFIQEISVKYHQ